MPKATTLASNNPWAETAIPAVRASVLSTPSDLSVVKQGVSSLW